MDRYEINIKNVSKSFKNQKVLKDISLSLESGKIYGIVGYNGSGKTVLFKCICGFYKVDQGEITVNGKVIGKDVDILPNAGILIEEPGYVRDMTGYQNLDILYCVKNKPNRKIIEETMKRVGLDPKSKKRVSHYSLGMKQRLAIAQATMEDQKILILDEPMNGLDKNGIEQMRNYYRQKREEGKLILLASHNPLDIEILCDEIYLIEDGCLRKMTNDQDKFGYFCAEKE